MNKKSEEILKETEKTIKNVYNRFNKKEFEKNPIIQDFLRELEEIQQKYFN